MGTKKVEFYDTTLRDGVQSLWAMKMTYGIHAAVVEELDKAGYSYIEIPVNGVNAKHQVRFLKENPWDYAHLFGEKIKKTKKSNLSLNIKNEFIEWREFSIQQWNIKYAIVKNSQIIQ